MTTSKKPAVSIDVVRRTNDQRSVRHDSDGRFKGGGSDHKPRSDLGVVREVGRRSFPSGDSKKK